MLNRLGTGMVESMTTTEHQEKNYTTLKNPTTNVMKRKTQVKPNET